MDEVIEKIIGVFIVTIYKSDNYMVSKFKTKEGQITVTGPSFDYDARQKYVLNGTYIDHPKYGHQFSILSIEKYLSDNKDEIISFLSSDLFTGIGKKVALKIYNYFGDDTLKKLKDNPSLIYELKDISKKQSESIIEGFESLNNPETNTIFHLISNGFSNSEAKKIFNKFKLDTLDISQSNPFKFYTDVYGIGFDKVKEYASKIEFCDAEIKYAEAYLIYLINEYTFNNGDTYINIDILFKMLNKYLNNIDFNELIDKAIEDKYLVKEDDRLYLANDYYDEIFIANSLKRYLSDDVFEDFIVNYEIESLEDEYGIKYDTLQKDAILNFFKHNMSIIIGGPGTGKTTIVKAMVNIFKKLSPFENLIVVAPTGRAAKRINEICDVESKTIHSLLKWDKETNIFVHDSDNPLMYDVIIIDEFSMVDNSLFASLLKASQKVKKICIIGDNNQLPSIRPGFVLNNLIDSNLFITTYLKFNYRQNKGSEIIKLCDDIKNGNLDLNKYHKDIQFIDINDENYSLSDSIKDDIDNGYPLNEIQVLTPMYKGKWGIDNLNKNLQAVFNPKDISKVEKQFGDFIFREQDKILQLKNRPNDDVYNGDIGILEEIDLHEKSLLVRYNDVLVFYNYDELIDISLAYALSVHKSQGSEYQVVYFVVSKYNLYMLNRNLIYTAVSRAKNKLVIISDEEIMKQGIQKLMKERNTTLLKRLLDE